MRAISITSISPAEFEALIKKCVEETIGEKIEKQTYQTELLSVDEAAKFLGLKKATVYSKVSRGELPVMKRAKKLYFSRTELIKYIKAGKRRTIDEIDNCAEKYIADHSSISR